MSTFFKVGSKKKELPEDFGKDWSLERRPGGWVVAVHSKTGERRRLMVSQVRTGCGIAAGGKLYQGTLEKVSRGGSSTAGNDADLISQFPGKVRKVLAQAGVQVEEGTPLLLVEAMKMEFTIRAPYAGLLKVVHVKDGQQISPGTRFVDLVPEEKGSK